MEGRKRGEHLGLSMAPAGDVDGDGTPDFAAMGMQDDADSPPMSFVQKFVRVYSGKARKTVLTAAGLEGPNVVGLSIAGPGDLDRDGKGDLVIGNPFQPKGTGSSWGMVRAYSGATGSTIWSTFGARGKDSYGAAVVCVGDVDGDGIPDLAVAAGFDEDLRLMAKRSRIEELSGKTGALVRTIHLPDPGEFVVMTGLVEPLAGIGDLDGDGTPDIAARTATVSDGGGDAWQFRVRIVSGKDGRLLQTLAMPPDEQKPPRPPK
jgi:hypothetical protein